MQSNSEFFPAPTAHRIHWEQSNCAFVYEYDSTADGPEWWTARVILSSHDPEELDEERRDTEARHAAHAHAMHGSITSRYYV